MKPELLRELHFSHSRSSGKGGQNVNKVSTKVTLHWYPASSTAISKEMKTRLLEKVILTSDGAIVIASDRHRSQPMNKEDCIQKLEDLIRRATYRAKVRKATKPSRSSIKKRIETKGKHSKKKEMRRKSDY